MNHLFDSVYYVGAADRTKTLFENLFPLNDGMRYNSYLIDDEKTALLDTADEAVEKEFLFNVKAALGKKDLDYLIVHHAEPDHSSLVCKILDLYPNAVLVTSVMALKFLNQFSGKDLSLRTKTVKEGDSLSLGKKTLKFIAAPMVHWPEVLLSFEESSGILFSADAFGSFGAAEGTLKISEVENPENWTYQARRYYTNIVGKFGTNVTALLKKAAALNIKKICPLHGLIFDENCSFPVEKYKIWSSYSPEGKGVLIVYGSMYSHTKFAAEYLAARLGEKNIPSKIVDVSYTDISYIISDCFYYPTFVFAAPTYYGGVFPKMERLLTAVKKINFSDRKIAFMENGTWAPAAAKTMKDILSEISADTSFPNVTIRSACNEETLKAIESLADAIANS